MSTRVNRFGSLNTAPKRNSLMSAPRRNNLLHHPSKKDLLIHGTPSAIIKVNSPTRATLKVGASGAKATGSRTKHRDKVANGSGDKLVRQTRVRLHRGNRIKRLGQKKGRSGRSKSKA